jgi:hypothetical protein
MAVLKMTTSSASRGCSGAGRPRRLLRALLVAALAVAVPTRALAGGDSVAGSALKAAFLYNFAKFSEWPAEALAPGQRLSMCVVDDSAIADALTQTIKGHEIDGHELMVTLLKAGGSASGCQLLYVAASEVKRSAALLAGLRGAAVFTVSDADHFAESGGVAQLIVEHDRMRFAINIASAHRARLIISSKLLSLAQIVKDEGVVRPL